MWQCVIYHSNRSLFTQCTRFSTPPTTTMTRILLSNELSHARDNQKLRLIAWAKKVIFIYLLFLIDMNDAFGDFDEWIAVEKSLFVDAFAIVSHWCSFTWTRWQNACRVFSIAISLFVGKIFDNNLFRLALIIMRILSCANCCCTFTIWSKPNNSRKMGLSINCDAIYHTS